VRRKKRRQYGLIDLEGGTFGRWFVVERADNDKWGAARFDCICECDTRRLVKGASLREGASKSCGCLHRDLLTKQCGSNNSQFIHGYAAVDKPEYNAWVNMRENYPSLVCKRWQDFRAFIADMGHKPAKTRLRRINRTKGYYPSNVFWRPVSA
jgi:hypothetical protein